MEITFNIVFVVVVLSSTLTSKTKVAASNDDGVEEYGLTTCAYTHTNDSIGVESSSSSDVFVVGERRYVGRCKFCFSIWRDVDDVDDSVSVDNDVARSRQIISQGCWLNSDDCSETRCVMTRKDTNLGLDSNPNPDLGGLNFCCCSGDNCNSDISTNVSSRLDGRKPTADVLSPISESGSIATVGVDYIYIGLASFFAASTVAFLCLAIVIWMRLRNRGQQKSRRESDCESLCDRQNNENIAKLSQKKDVDLSNLVVDGIVGQGKYGVVYKGHLRASEGSSDAIVAVKVFSAAQRKSFFEEREVYELARMSNLQSMTNSMLDYFGSAENANINSVICDSVLVVSYAERGSLLSFLKSETVSWPELCKMLQNIAEGLSALHSGFQDVGTQTFPSICHRDLNCRNILVRSDLTCCIADFGSSIRIRGSTIFRNGSEFSAESGGLSDAGTVRYLAPELLEGALNLFDCETSLKQADVYSMALVFWELSRRCQDLYQGATVDCFEQAYERELGCLCPTMDQMRNLVVRNRARPLFPEIWKKSNPAVQQLQETIEDSWDHDGEARLTAACILERISQLQGLWDHYKMTSHGPPLPDSTIPNPVAMRPCLPGSASSADSLSSLTGSTATDASNLSPIIAFAPNVDGLNEVSVKNDNVLSGQLPVKKIQPYQGRNLCLERNMISPTDLDSSESSPLIEKSTKDAVSCWNNVHSGGTNADNVVNPTSPTLMASRFQNAIPYVKNDFSRPQTSSNDKNATPKNGWFRKPQNSDSQVVASDKNSVDKNVKNVDVNKDKHC